MTGRRLRLLTLDHRTHLIIVCAFLIPACAANKPAPEFDAATPPSVSSRVDSPSLCLALSGGGLRSGSVSLGLLQELHLSGELSKFDIVSSVSGGGYPVYGLIYKMSSDGVDLDQLLAEDSPYISQIERETFVDSSEIFAHVATTTLWAIPDFLFGWIVRSTRVIVPTTSSNLYMFNIQETFIGPGSVRKHLLYDIDLDSIRGFPYPIFIAAANPGGRPPSKKHEYHIDDLFELSPSWIGSPATGYAETEQFVSLENAIVASGSAVDSPYRDNCISLPDKICGKDSPKTPYRKPSNTLPFGLKLLGFNTGFSIIANDRRIYLGDGGFIEGLGLLPLLRKGCEKIVSLDASHDPELDFSELRLLKHFVDNMGGELELHDDIEDLKDTRAWQLPRHYFRMSVRFQGARSTLHYIKLGINGDNLQIYPEEVSSYARKNWSGSFEPAELRQCRSPRSKLENAPGCGTLERGFLKDACSFPHEETFRLCYESDEFRAYRMLGRYLASLIDLDRVEERIEGRLNAE